MKTLFDSLFVLVSAWWAKLIKSRSHHLGYSVLWDFTLYGHVQVTMSIWSTLANADSGRSLMGLLGNPLNTLMSPLVYHIFLWNSAFFPTDSTNSCIFQESTWSSGKYLFHDNKQDEWGWEPCHQAKVLSLAAAIRIDVQITFFFLELKSFEVWRQIGTDIHLKLLTLQWSAA